MTVIKALTAIIKLHIRLICTNDQESDMEHQKSEFRKDIAGLRAIAVVMVIAFHLGSLVPLSEQLQGSALVIWLNQSFSAGFLGVDVFFVISGYLMTSIIFRRVVEADRPVSAVWSFWKARAVRIVPALLFAVLFFSVIAVQLFDPQRFASFARELRYALLFTSNLRYAREDGYFEESSLDKILLHTWSLSVEWQFYLIYPVILAAVGRMSGHKAAVRSTLLMAAAFTLAAAVLPADQGSYFMFHFRAWELLAGAIVYLYPCSLTSSALRKAVLYIGLAAILVSPLICAQTAVWSMRTPVMAVVGAAMVIWVNSSSLLLDNPVSQFLGKISYSLYIYHWPIMVIMAMMLILNAWAALAATLIMATLSYYFVERRRDFGWKLAVLFVCTYFTAQHAYKSEGWIWRADPDKFNVLSGTLYVRQSGFGVNDPITGHRTEPANYDQLLERKVILFGDSHADHFTLEFRKHYGDQAGFVISHGALAFQNLKFSIMTASFSEDLISRLYNNLSDFIKRLDKLHSGTAVVISGNWSEYEHVYNEETDLRPDLCVSADLPCQKIRNAITFKQALYQELKDIVSSRPDLHFFVPSSLYVVPLVRTWRDFDSISSPLTSLYQHFANTVMAPEYLIKYGYVTPDLSRAHAIDEVFIRLEQELPNFHSVDIRAPLCLNEDRCRVMDDDGAPLFYDDDHLSAHGAAIAARPLLEAIDSVIAARSQTSATGSQSHKQESASGSQNHKPE